MKPSVTPRWIVLLQYASIAWMWFFVLGISGWILHLIQLSRKWNDVPSASVAISIVAIPVFLTGASVLTYVFWGLHTADDDPQHEPHESRRGQS